MTNPAVSPETRSRTEPAKMEPAESREQSDLQSRYGSIGINAVAAAVRYSNPGKKPAELPTAPRIDQRFQESAT